MAETIANLFFLAVFIAILVAVLDASFQEDRWTQEVILRHGVEVEAEILARFEAGARQGSELAKARPTLAEADEGQGVRGEDDAEVPVLLGHLEEENEGREGIPSLWLRCLKGEGLDKSSASTTIERALNSRRSSKDCA